MKMPRSFKLGLYRIAIKRPRSLEDYDDAPKRPRCPEGVARPRKTLGVYVTDPKGDFSYRNHEISVRRDLDGMLAKEILHHELGHAVWDYSGLAAAVPEKYEELVVSGWTQAWLQLMRENPKLAEFLYWDDEA